VDRRDSGAAPAEAKTAVETAIDETKARMPIALLRDDYGYRFAADGDAFGA
jgi:hypothetical protein